MSKLYQKINGSAVPLSGGVGIVNNLTSTSTTDALSANMGKVLGEKVNNNTNIVTGNNAVLIGTFNGYSLYRIVKVFTGITDDETFLSDALPVSGGQIANIYGVAHYDNNEACVPLGQYASSEFYVSVGVNSNNRIYIMSHTNNRVSRVYVYIEYFTN